MRQSRPASIPAVMISLARYVALLEPRDMRQLCRVRARPAADRHHRPRDPDAGADDTAARSRVAARPPAAMSPASPPWRPLLGTVIDRYGPRRSADRLRRCFSRRRLLALVAACRRNAPPWLRWRSPQQRARRFRRSRSACGRFFKRRLREETLLAPAYSLESVLIETDLHPRPGAGGDLRRFCVAAAAVWFAAACGSLGTLALSALARRCATWRIEQRGATQACSVRSPNAVSCR